MAVTSIYELAVPSPYDTSFVDDEKALSVAATISGAAGGTTYYLSKWFDFQGGIYVLKMASADATMWLASLTKTNGRVVHRSAAADGVVTRSIYLPAGRRRLDIIIGNVASGTSSAFVAFSLFQDGRLVYASSGAGWVFDTSIPVDADVPALGDARLAFPVLPILPNWKESITERIEWRTELFNSESDTEQRRSLRRFPVRTFEASFDRHNLRRSRLINFFIGTGSSRFLMPLWHEQFSLTAALGSTLQFPAGTLAYREFKVNDLVWVNGGDPAVGELLKVQSIDTGTDTITFASAPVGTWGAGDRVFPLRVARRLEPAQIEDLTDRVSRARARFTLDDNETWPTPSWGSPGRFFDFDVDRGSSITLGIDRTTDDVIDNDIGKIEVYDPYERTRLSMRVAMTFRGRNRLFAFRQFIHMARGRAVRFWMPTHSLDLIGTTDFTGSYIDVLDSGLTEYLKRTQQIRAVIGFVMLNGDATIYRNVTLVTKTLQGERVFLESALPSLISRSNVHRVMFIMAARFDQDGFEMNHLVDDSRAVQTSVVVRSTDIGDLPDL